MACAIVVSGGSAYAAMATSSKPTTLMSRGTAPAASPDRAHRPDRHEVVVGDDAGRRRAPRSSSRQQRRLAAADAGVADHDRDRRPGPGRGPRGAAGRRRAAAGASALRGAGGEDADPAMAEVEQVRRRLPPAVEVVGGDRRDGGSPGAAVLTRTTGSGGSASHSRWRAPRPLDGDDDAVDPPVDEQVEVGTPRAPGRRRRCTAGARSPCSRATSSTARTSCGKNGFSMSVMISPSVWVVRSFSERATPDGR